MSVYFMQAWDDQRSHSIDCRRVKSLWVRRRGAQGGLLASRPNDVGRPRQQAAAGHGQAVRAGRMTCNSRYLLVLNFN